MNFRVLSPTVLCALAIACSAPEQAVDETPDPNSAAEQAPPAQTGADTGYSDAWKRVPYWSGEYPNAPAVVGADIVVMALPAISKDGEASLPCPLPQKAVYSPWNIARAEADQLEFVTMSYPTRVEIKEAVEIETFQADTPTTLNLSPGYVLIYENYLSEGWFMAKVDGMRYELNESDLPQSTVFEQGPEDDQWLRITCADAEATQAWVRYIDLLKVPGIEPYNYTGYAEAADLP